MIASARIAPKVQIAFALFMAAAVAPSLSVAAERATPGLAFSLKDTTGRDVALTDFRDKKAVVVVFTGTECPVNNYYIPRLKELHQKYAAQGVQFLAVNSNPQDRVQDVAEHAKREGLPFPVLKDADQKVAVDRKSVV